MEKRKLTRRDFLRLTTAAATGAIVAACAPAAPEVIEVEKEVPVEKVVKETVVVEKEVVVEKQVKPAQKPIVRLWHNWTGGVGSYANALTVLAERFNEAHTDIYCDLTYIALTGGTQASEKLMASIAGGIPPEATFFDRFLTATWAARELLTDLTPLADQSGITEDMFFPFAWGESTYKDKLYTIPWDTDGRKLYSDVAALKEAGFHEPPKTWDEMDAYAEKLTIEEGGRLKQLGFVQWYGSWLPTWAHVAAGKSQNVMWDFEKETCAVNTEPWIEAAEWLLSYAEKYDVERIDSFTSAFGQETLSPFCMGQLAMRWGGSWMMGLYDKWCPEKEALVSHAPGPDGPSKINMAGGWSTTIPMGVPDNMLDPAWEVLLFYHSPESQDYFFKETTNWPVLVEVTKDPFYSDTPGKKVFWESLSEQWNRPSIPEIQLLCTEINKAQDLIIHGKKRPKEALDETARVVNEAMEQWR